MSSSYIKKNISLAWPLALNALLMQSMLMIDTLLVSPLGEIPLAAMGIATTIIAFILGIQIALANGTQLVLSRAVGSGHQENLNKAFVSGVIINGLTSLLFWLLLSVFDQLLIESLTDNLSLHIEIASYLNIAKYVVLFTAITQVIIALFNGLGKSRIPFNGYLIELPINALASYLFIHGCLGLEGLGVQGAAIGSIIAIFIRTIFLYYCVKHEQQLSLSFSILSAHLKHNIYQHFREVFPIAANVAMLSIGTTIYQLLYSQLTINSYVAITLLMPWIRSGTQFITSWSHSSAIIISQAIGSKQMETLKQDVETSIKIAIFISILSTLFFIGLYAWINDIYPDLAVETYQALKVIAPLYIVLPILRGYNTVHGHVLRALGKTTAVFKINFTGQWLVSLPLCALIILVFDASIFWAFAITPFEELVKTLPFRYLAKKSLAEFNLAAANKLMYD